MCNFLSLDSYCRHSIFHQKLVGKCSNVPKIGPDYCNYFRLTSIEISFYCNSCIVLNANIHDQQVIIIGQQMQSAPTDVLRQVFRCNRDTTAANSKIWWDMRRHCRYMKVEWSCDHLLWEGRVLECAKQINTPGIQCDCNHCTLEGRRNTVSYVAAGGCGCEDRYHTPDSM
ncbi:hypothetical protein CC78DRAFT_537322 [Lojkania enalia]|uniref:Uncharacterized protein n=1 Tax=Lojkania enalia TaxID=147567 RepID=A0A9P4K0M8_9PLEO|nr:hypothetical protein CC78DRAFT_537322 [Didymosphaeria enalia]